MHRCHEPSNFESMRYLDLIYFLTHCFSEHAEQLDWIKCKLIRAADDRAEDGMKLVYFRRSIFTKSALFSHVGTDCLK